MTGKSEYEVFAVDVVGRNEHDAACSLAENFFGMYEHIIAESGVCPSCAVSSLVARCLEVMAAEDGMAWPRADIDAMLETTLDIILNGGDRPLPTHSDVGHG